MPAQATKSKPDDLLPDLKKRYPGIDLDKFIALVNADYSSYQLATEFNVSQTKAYVIKCRLNDINQTLAHFKDNKIDYLLSQQYKAIELQAKIIEFYLQDSEFKSLSDQQKVNLLNATNNIAGTLEDKQQTIVNVKGNLQVINNNMNITPEEIKQIQGNQVIDIKAELGLSNAESVKQITDNV